MKAFFTQGPDGLTQVSLAAPLPMPNFPEIERKVAAILDLNPKEWKQINTFESVDGEQISNFLNARFLRWKRIYQLRYRITTLLSSVKSSLTGERDTEDSEKSAILAQ